MNKKQVCLFYAPVECYAGYGAKARDLIKAFHYIKGNEWDLKIIPCKWGSTPRTFIKDHPNEWGWLEDYFINPQEITQQPEYCVWITVPNEVQKWGKINILFTAGIETTICAPQWIQGCNRADLVIVPSQHSKTVFENASFSQKSPQGQIIGNLELTTPVKVLFEGYNEEIYGIEKSMVLNTKISEVIDDIPENFAFLTIGHWMQGDLGHDRKNIALTIKLFYETFKNQPNKPALILKTSQSSSSYMDRREILHRINKIKKSIDSKDLPKVYLFHGEITDTEINELYNHPKIKAMVSLTKGEGFGRPLLEFSSIGKPIIASNWSGHKDFLLESATLLLPGQLHPLDKSSQVKDMLIEGSNWFAPDINAIQMSLLNVYKKYGKFKKAAKNQKIYVENNFTWSCMVDKLEEIIQEDFPQAEQEVELKLPKLQKI